MKKMTSEKKHKITTIGLWLILILCTAVLFSLCLSEGSTMMKHTVIAPPMTIR